MDIFWKAFAGTLGAIAGIGVGLIIVGGLMALAILGWAMLPRIPSTSRNEWQERADKFAERNRKP